MTFVVDASVVVRWFLDQQPGKEEALDWLDRFAADGTLLLAPDILRFEVYGALARHQPADEPGWAAERLHDLEQLGLPILPTTRELFARGLSLSSELSIGGYDALYLAHAEALGMRWLTADQRALRRLSKDPRVQELCPSG